MTFTYGLDLICLSTECPKNQLICRCCRAGSLMMFATWHVFFVGVGRSMSQSLFFFSEFPKMCLFTFGLDSKTD